ncbi:MAG: lycopene cyclase domain-containing protein [Bacteroidales bacterium]
MTWLYALLLLSSFVVPLAMSFDKNMQLYKRWNVVLPSIALVAVVYMLADIYLTRLGVWGFDASYNLGIFWFGLPLEEWLFFVIVPYASLFIHYTFLHYFTHLHLKEEMGKAITIALMVFLLIVLAFNFERLYTAYILSFLLVALALSMFDKSRVIDKLYVSFLIILIPFIIVNGILTGSFINGEVVWYNNTENLGIRFFTIPIEDFAYGFSLILFNLLLIERLSKKTITKA